MTAPANGAQFPIDTVRFQGLAEPHATIKLIEGASTLKTTEAGDAGAWVIDLTDIPDGPHTYSLTATDGATNESDAATRTVTVDTVAPQTTLNVAPNGVTKNSRPRFEFTSEPGARFECQIEGTYADCTSPFVSPTLADGTYRFFVRAIDAAGNVGEAAQSGEFTVDTIAPGAPAIDALSSPRTSSAVDLTGTAEAGATVTITDAGASRGVVNASGSGRWALHLECQSPTGRHDLPRDRHRRRRQRVRRLGRKGRRRSTPSRRPRRRSPPR